MTTDPVDNAANGPTNEEIENKPTVEADADQTIEEEKQDNEKQDNEKQEDDSKTGTPTTNQDGEKESAERVQESQQSNVNEEVTIEDVQHNQEEADTEVDRASKIPPIASEADGLIDEIDKVIETVQLESLDPNITPPPEVRPEDHLLNDMQDGNDPLVSQLLDEIEKDGDSASVEDIPTFDRDQLLLQYKEIMDEQSRIRQLNQQYQHKLAEYFKKKKTDDRGQEIEKNVTDQEQRYLKYMSNLENLQSAESRQANGIEIQLEDLKSKCHEKLERVEEVNTELIKYKHDIGKNSINSRSGKTIPQKDLEQYQAMEAKKEQEVIAIRLENIKLRNRLKKREQQLKAKEELAEGLHLIDFEQLKIENQTYNEKIEERNEELLKLRKKITTTVQVLTHLKEKLQFVQGENGEQRAKLRDIEVTVAQKRDILTRLKQVRDGLRIDNTKLKHKSGLLGNKPLLRDFEDRKEEGDMLQDRLETLKEQHTELNMNLSGIRKKIEKSKLSISPHNSAF